MTDPEAHSQEQPGDGVLRVSERIAAPRDAVFEFLVDPAKMLRWMGTAVDVDPVPGGKFWLNANGTAIAMGHYVAVDPPERVVFTWGWEGSADVPPGSTTVTIALISDGEETVVELEHRDLPAGADDQHGQGWSHLFSRLADAATGADPGPLEL
jgi:uncharacterized protein YndB with AHSA1/START domain